MLLRLFRPSLGVIQTDPGLVETTSALIEAARHIGDLRRHLGQSRPCWSNIIPKLDEDALCLCRPELSRVQGDTRCASHLSVHTSYEVRAGARGNNKNTLLAEPSPKLVETCPRVVEASQILPRTPLECSQCGAGRGGPFSGAETSRPEVPAAVLCDQLSTQVRRAVPPKSFPRARLRSMRTGARRRQARQPGRNTATWGQTQARAVAIARLHSPARNAEAAVGSHRPPGTALQR